MLQHCFKAACKLFGLLDLFIKQNLHLTQITKCVYAEHYLFITGKQRSDETKIRQFLNKHEIVKIRFWIYKPRPNHVDCRGPLFGKVPNQTRTTDCFGA